jgi:class 3 adenylate cyclase
MGQITPSPELASIVRRWLRAYATGDKAAVLNLFSADPALSYIGSAAEETWRDDDLRQAFGAYMDDIPRFDWEGDDFRGFECGALGWVEWNSGRVSTENGTASTFRATFILALEKGVWRIVHVHNSNPVPNMQAMGYEARGFDELLEATRPTDFGATGIASIMFTDIADSTTIAETIGDARWSAAVKRHVAQVGTIVTEHGGRLIKSLGDGTLSSFPSARAALSSAIAIQRAMADDGAEPRLQVRIGLHTGDLVAQDGDIIGTVVNKAARIAAIAAPGEIRLSDATRIMVGGASAFGFGAPATTPLRGLDGEHVIYRLDWCA